MPYGLHCDRSRQRVGREHRRGILHCNARCVRCDRCDRCDSLQHELFGQSPSEVVLYDTNAHDVVAQHGLGRLVVAGAEGNDTANAHDEGELGVGEARAVGGGDGRGTGLAHPWHVCEDDVMAADGAGGVRVGVAHGFVVGGPVIVPVVVEEGVDGIGFDWESADDGNLKEKIRPTWDELSALEEAGADTPREFGLKAGDQFNLPEPVLDIVKECYLPYTSRLIVDDDCYHPDPSKQRAALVHDLFNGKMVEHGAGVEVCAVTDPLIADVEDGWMRRDYMRPTPWRTPDGRERLPCLVWAPPKRDLDRRRIYRCSPFLQVGRSCGFRCWGCLCWVVVCRYINRGRLIRWCEASRVMGLSKMFRLEAN